MQTLYFNFSINTQKTPKNIMRSLLNVLEEEKIIDFSMSTQEEDFSEESVTEESEDLSIEEEDETPKRVSLNWDDEKIKRDLHELSCVVFKEKYGVSDATFYYNKKRIKNPFSHNRQEYSRSLINPEAFMEQFGYSENELPLIQKEARKVISAFYEGKYPGVLDVAGKFADRVVGRKYNVSGSTICAIRKMMGIEAFQPKNSSEN